MSNRHALARYQQETVEALSGIVEKVARLHSENPSERSDVALRSGVTLLQSPTGSGKTLILARALEALRGQLSRPVVWLWFAPYAGLVTQTRAAMAEQASGLRLRDVTSDREAYGTKDGDVFVQTWASVAANNKNARKVRRTSESKLSLDELVAEWRSKDFFLGVVIDEAHLHFGGTATVAAKFFLSVLRPDFTILATATPNDDKLEAFQRNANIEVASRIVIPRSAVVDAGLNKLGLRLGVIQFESGDEALIDQETATLTAAWLQHKHIKERLAEKGITLTPLLLVQVEDQTASREDPVERVKNKLLDIRVPAGVIREHTSGQPDPYFHTLAYDPEVEVLIFKVAVATGFDAPRAWSLARIHHQGER